MNFFELDVYKNKGYYIKTMIHNVRKNGIDECWILNKQNLEIYSFKATQISEFDVQIDLFNSLENDKIFSGLFIMHMRENILKLFTEVPGTIFVNKLDCYRALYSSLNINLTKTKQKKKIMELEEKIEYIEMEFPQLII
jgi:hypothetical protein